jgi:hypothetical protein
VRWLLLIALSATAFAAEKVEILRDEYSVPHIFAATAQGAAYASGYLQASDRPEQLLRHLKQAQHAGDAPVSTKMRAIIEAFCAGVNSVSKERIEPWMVTGYSRRVSIEGRAILIPLDRTASQASIAIIDPTEDYADPSYQMVVASADYHWVGAAPVGLPFPLTGHGYENTVGPGDIPRGADILDRVWAMQTGHHEMEPTPADASQASQMTRELLNFNLSLTIYDAIHIATSTDVYKADVWQKRIAEAEPDSEFTRMLTGWSRRMDFDSAGALAFYLFKMALGAEAGALEPPDSLSDNRVRAALHKARDQVELELPFQAKFGTVFRIGQPQSYPASGGTLTEAGMAAPRAVHYAMLGTNRIGVSGQGATQIMELIRPIPKSYMMIPFSGSPAKFARGEVQPTYFGDRKEMEKHAKSRETIFAP